LADGAQLGIRLRERDLGAAPGALNLLESTAPADREQAMVLLRELSPAKLLEVAPAQLADGLAPTWADGESGLPRNASRALPGGEAPGHIVGVTGPPGAGKSTLLSALLHAWREQGQTVAMLAVDPSSRRSGGSLLGDRARIEFDPADRGVFIRSTAAGERLGGIAWGTRAAAQALAAAFDVVVIETVGVGQAETEVAEIADTIVVVVQPGSGDVLQFLKSGIMETPDVLVVTKADLGQIATSARRDLAAALRSLGRRSTPVLAVCSLPPGTGVDELCLELSRRWGKLTGDGASELRAHRVRARRAGALTDFVVEHGQHGLRGLGGRRAAERWLSEQDPALDEAALVAALEGRMSA
jgi:LAO/AO transport system kinase